MHTEKENRDTLRKWILTCINIYPQGVGHSGKWTVFQETLLVAEGINLTPKGSRETIGNQHIVCLCPGALASIYELHRNASLDIKE